VTATPKWRITVRNAANSSRETVTVIPGGKGGAARSGRIRAFGFSPDGQVFIIAGSTAGNASPTRHKSVASLDRRYRSWVLGSSHPARIGALSGDREVDLTMLGP
jgi:hypothetical protein